MPPAPFPRRALIEELEPRLLFSADFAPGLADALNPQTEQRVIGANGEFTNSENSQQQAQHARLEVVFIDLRVQDYEKILADIHAQNTEGHSIEVVLLDSERDGVAQIGEFLSQRQDIDAIHLISHGSAGSIQLGAGELNFDSLLANASAIRQWGNALSDDADILIYGCDVVSTENGQSLVNALGRLTGADVAASDDKTGAESLGGDWVLEYQTGAIETASMVSAGLAQSWAHVLAIIAGASSSAGTGAATEASSVTWSHTVSSGSDRILIVSVATRDKNGGVVSSVTYGGTSLTKIAADSSSKTHVEMWYLKAPAVGMADIVVTLTSIENFTAGATTLYGVDQATPYGSLTTGNGSGNPSLTVASAAGELVVDAVADLDVDSSAVGAGQSALWVQTNGTASNDAWGGSSTEAGAASVTMSWATNGASAGEWAAVAVSLKPSLNTAPILDATKSPSLATQIEDAGAPSGAVGTLVSSLVDFASPSGQMDNVTDPDAGALPGIAITAADMANGIWHYSTDNGTNWNALGAVSEANARLLAADANTRLYFQPNANYNGTLINAITFRAWDQTSGSNGSLADTTANGGTTAFSNATDTASLAINPVNDAPVITSNGGGASAAVSVPKNTLAVTTITATDVDLPVQTLTYSIIGGADAAKFTINGGTGALSFIAAPNFEAPADSDADNVYHVTVQVSDGSLTDTQAIAVTVTNANDFPVADADSFSGSEDTAITGNVLANDADPDGNPLTAILVSGPANGSLALNPDGSFSHTPNADWNGTDSFQYLVNDGSGPVHYWGLEGSGSDAIDGASGTLMNGPATIAGKAGSALQFDGIDDYVLLPDLSYGNEFSLSFYFKVADNSGTGLQYFYSHGTLPNTGQPNTVQVALVESGYAITPWQQNHIVTTVWDSNDPGSGQIFVDIASLIGDGQWHQYALTVTAGVGTQVYIDGVLRGSLTTGGDAIDPTGNAYLGARSDLDSTRFLKAGSAMDSVALYNRALSASEIASLNTNSQQAVVTLAVNPVADTPSVTNAATDEDTQTSGGLVISRNAADGAEVTHFKITGISNGTLFKKDGVTQIANGSFITFAEGSAGLKFTPTADFNGNGSFTVQASTTNGDAGLGGGTVNATITVNAVNDAPVLDNSGAMTLISIGEDDTGNAGQTVASIIASAGGDRITDVDFGAQKGITITGLASGNGTWQYSTDGGVNWNNIGAVSNSWALLLRDTDQVRFVPDAQNGTTASFSFRAWDQTSGSAGDRVDTSVNGSTTAFSVATETASITVTPVNDAPAGADITISTNEDAAYIFAEADFGFTDPSDSPSNTLLAVTITTLPSAGSLTLNGVAVTAGQIVSAADIGAGLLRFTPAANAYGTGYASFTFQVQDNGGTAHGGVDLDSAPNTITINVTPVNDAPTVAHPIADQSATEDAAFSFQIPANSFADVDPGDSLAYTASGVPAWLGFDAATRTFSGTPANADAGSYTITVRATDGSGAWAEDSFDIVVANSNDAPVVTPVDLGSMAEDGSLLISTADLLTGATDADGDALSVMNLTLVSGNGVLTDHGDGSWTFTPAADWHGSVAFGFDVSDGTVSTPNTASLSVNPVNDAPVASDDSLSGDEDSVISGNVLANDNDVDSAGLTANLVTGPAHGTLVLNADGSFAYTPDANWHGSDSFTYLVSDGSLDSAIATVSLTVNPVNDAPTASDASFTVNEDSVYTGALPAASDIDSAVIAYALDANATHGSAIVSSDGSFSYTPDSDYFGPDSFTYTVFAGAGGSNTYAVTITVDAVNDAPVVTPVDLGAISEDGGLIITQAMLLAGASDAELDSLTAINLTLIAGRGTLTDNGDGSWTFTPNSDWNGGTAFSFDVFDGTASTPNTASLIVNPINDAPIIAGNTLSISEGGMVVLNNANLNVFDAEQSAAQLTYTVSNVSHGQFEWAANPGVASSSFTQADIDAGLVVFVHDASDVAPAYDVFVSDGVTITGPNAATIHFAPVDEGINVTSLSGTHTTEAGGTVTFDVTLNSQPMADVTVFIASGNPAEGTASVSSLTFTAANWNVAQQVTVTGVDDFIDDGDQPYAIQMHAVSGDRNYDQLAAPDVALTNLDDDTAGIVMTPSSGLVTDESGRSDHFSVVLTSQPLANVVIDLGSSNPAEGRLSSHSLTFTPSNWNIPQIVQVTGVNDAPDNGDVVYQIIAAPAASADTVYDGLAAGAVDITNRDVAEPTVIDPLPIELFPEPLPVMPPTDVAAAPEAPEQTPAPESAPNLQPIAESGFAGNQSTANLVDAALNSDLKISTAMLVNSQSTQREVLTKPETQGGMLLRLLDILQVEHVMGDSGGNRISPSVQVEIIQDEQFRVEILSQGAQITAVSLSVGAVWWALRAGGLFTSLLTSLPAWRSFDVLPVLSRDDDAAWGFGDEPEDDDNKDGTRMPELTP